MATPQESTTTVNGRRCTRSRARTAATSTLTSAAAETTFIEIASSTTTSDVQQIQSSTAAAPPSSAAAAPVVASSSPAASSQIGTDNQTSAFANLVPSPPAAVAPDPGAVVSETVVAGPSVVTASITPSSTTRSSTPTSNTIIAAITSASPDPTTPAESSVEPPPDESSALIALPSGPVSEGQPDQPQPTGTSNPSGSGIIAPEQGNGDDEGLTISTGVTNVGGIVGGVVGGFAALVLISALLFLCLRKRRSKEPFGKWSQRLSEKNDGESSFLARSFKAIRDKARMIPTSLGLMFSKLKGKKSGPAENPYRRHSVRSSVSSVYSARSNGRSQSISEPPSKFRQQLRGFGFGDRMPSLKRSRTLLAKKQDSLVVGSKSPFPGIVEDPVLRNSNGANNPFADPEPLEPPKTLFALNPDPLSREGSPSRAILDGLQDQQRPPLTPKPVAMPDRGSSDPFASIWDELEGERDGLRDTSHKRTQSATIALRSHPPSAAYTASIYTTADNPFFDPSDTPPVPSQPLPPNPPLRPTNTYTPALPAFNATSSAASRESNGSFFFGEPGPSRPSTNLFSNVSLAPRVGRQSDPFDLDRPEVLGFGNVSGRREVRASVTRNNSRRRTSSVPNWVSVDDGPYERSSAVPGPLRNPSVKRY